MENLKKEILSGIPSYDSGSIEWHGIDEFMHTGLFWLCGKHMF